MCNHEELNLEDVDEDLEVRRYGNTFINSKHLKETLREAGDDGDKDYLLRVDKFVETLQQRQAASASNFHPAKLHDEGTYNF